MKRELVILGAGAHASVIIDMVEQVGKDVIVGLLDDRKTGRYEGYAILGTMACLPELIHLHTEYFIVAIGDNEIRQHLFQTALHWRLIPMTVIHPSASISPKAEIGVGTVIMPHVVVNAHARIGKNVILNTGCTVDHHCLVGDHAHIAPGANLAGNVNVHNGALVKIGSAIPPNTVMR